MSDDQRRSDTPRVTVLGSFTLTHAGTTVPLDVDARRLVAYLAVHPRPQQRAALAADLWPGVPTDAALRLLAEVLAAVAVPDLFDPAADDAAQGPLALAAAVEVDLAEAMALVRALPEVPAGQRPALTALTTDLLPGWTAAWIAVERERFRQLRLHALEERSLRLTAAGRFDEAVVVALSAVHAAPSREAARRVLIEAYLAQGSVAAAVAQYDEYQKLIRSSVGPVPSGFDGLLPPSPAWPVLRVRRPLQHSAAALPGVRRPVRGTSATTRRLVAGGSAPGTSR